MQGPKPIRGPTQAPHGGSIEIEVGAGVTTVYVGQIGGGAVTPHPVGPDGKASIPVPPVPTNTVLWLSTSKKGRNVHLLLVEVVENE